MYITNKLNIAFSFSINHQFDIMTENKLCCHKETMRCLSYSFWFNVRQPNKLNQTKQSVFTSRFECEIYITHVTRHLSYPCFSWNFGCSLWSRSMMLWSLHTENTRLISLRIIFDVLRPIYHETLTSWTHFVHFATLLVSVTLNLT